VAAPGSRYAPGAAPDYSHRFHAGNVGDVWKHCVLLAWLGRIAAARPAVRYVETHAGEGEYALASTGEWTEGVGRLWTADATHDPAVDGWLATCRRLAGGGPRPVRYPGSPRLAAAVLPASASLALWERDPTAAARLRACVGDDPRAVVHAGDGLAALEGAVRGGGPGAPVALLVDPPWTEKADWTRVPDALVPVLRDAPHVHALLWYPVKSLTRPNAMTARLARAGVAGTIAEFVTTPLDERRHRLNGSGVLLVRPPAGVPAAIAAAAPVLGERCATRAGAWSFRMVSWPGA